MNATATAAELRSNLANQLNGKLHDIDLVRAFADVPRHQFMPRFHRWDSDGGQWFARDTDPDAWLAEAYTDNSLVTKYDLDTDIALSSSTAPSLMGLMLEAADLHPGDSTLEIGTGTGYNTALLCRRVGHDLVTSIEIDAELAQAAMRTLAGLGMHPNIVTGDGLGGYEVSAPYDRLIATCATRNVPTSWITQTRPGGILIVNVGSGVAKLLRDHDGGAAGEFVDMAGFIEARPADGPRIPATGETVTLATYSTPETAQDDYQLPDDIDDERFWFLARLLLPGLTRVTLLNDPDADHTTRCLADADTRSWAAVETTAGVGTIRQGGTRRLWTELTNAHTGWTAAGRPSHTDLTLTVIADGTHTVTTRDGSSTWQMP